VLLHLTLLRILLTNFPFWPHLLGQLRRVNGGACILANKDDTKMSHIPLNYHNNAHFCLRSCNKTTVFVVKHYPHKNKQHKRHVSYGALRHFVVFDATNRRNYATTQLRTAAHVLKGVKIGMVN
jgi:hypothetical protein